MKDQKKTKRIEITQYTDYVLFIIDLIEYKRNVTGFSYRVFCRNSGFKSPSYLKWIIEKVRPISLKSIHKFIAGLSLDKQEAHYFTLMVNYKEAKDPQTKRFFYEQMLAWQQRHKSSLTKDAYEYLSHWYFVAIRELIASNDFKDDPRWIRDRIGGNLTLWDIKNSFETLERLKLIKRNKQGRWVQTTKDLHTKSEVKSLAAYSYHTEMLDLAQQALTKRSAEERNYQSLVALISEKTYSGLNAKIQKFQLELVDYLQQEEKKQNKSKPCAEQELYALNMQMLPLTVRR